MSDDDTPVMQQDTLQTVSFGECFKIGPSGLDVIGKPSFEQCEALWETLRTMEKSIQFAIGDAMKYFRERWGERADQIISDGTGWSLETLRAYEWTSDKVRPEVRMIDRGLSYSHHQAVAKLPPVEQKKWLAEAVDGDAPWPVSRLKQAIKANGDLDVTAWFVIVRAKDEASRDRLMSELESRGFICKSTDRRGEKKETS